MAWSRTWTPFGITVSEVSGGTFATSVAFPGQTRDSETALSYNYFRDYDPSLGRYIQSDPIGIAGGLNTYGYVYNTPANLIDPTGEAGVAGFFVGAGVDLIYQLIKHKGNIKCVNWWDVLDWGLTLSGAGFGLKIGKAVAKKAIKGGTFSHWIPKRYAKKWPFNNSVGKKFLKKGNPYNGQNVPPQRHYRHDPYYYGHRAGDGWKRKNIWGSRYGKLRQQWDRIPPPYKGAGAGAAIGHFLAELLSPPSACECEN